jgi:long-chain acyl-CoA synthetase
MIGNRPEWPLVFFAIMYAGAIPVPVNSQATPQEIGHILADAGCAIAFTESGSPAIGIRSVSVDSSEFNHSRYLFPQIAYIPTIGRDDDACIMYTSGTTANPKGVVLSHGNLLANMRSLYELGLMKSGDGIVSVLPLYHAYAMVVTTVGPLVYGGKVVYPGSIRSKEVMRAIRESKAALFVGVPLIFEMFHKTVKESFEKMPWLIRFPMAAVSEIFYAIRRKTGVNLSRYLFYPIHRSLGASMRVYMSGGARLKEDIERDLFKLGFTVLNGYGLTETSPVLTVNPLERPKIGSVGLPIADVEIRIARPDEKGVGEVLVRGPNVMKGYYKNEELTRRSMEDGWLRTGDTGYLDTDGYLFLTGRLDDAIALATGLSISPDELEDVYLAGSPVKELCIFDIPSSRPTSDTAVLQAIAVPDMEYFDSSGIRNAHAAVKEAFEKVSRRLSIPERLMGFSLTLDVLPRTLLGIIKWRELKRRYLAGEIKEAFGPVEKRLSEADRELVRRPDVGTVMDCLRTQTKVKVITPNDSFELDLGIDLVGRAELASELEKRLGLKIQEDKINSVFTVKELIATVGEIMR